MRVDVCAVGFKGEVFLKGLIQRDIPIAQVFTYRQQHDLSESFDGIAALCRSFSIPIVENRRPGIAEMPDADLIFVIGWQYLLSVADSRLIVFHDSLLPRYRGFAPTVTSLIAGDEVIGVSALHPAEGIDSGPILAQAQFCVHFPARIDEVLRRQAELMVELAVNLVETKATGNLAARPQDESQASYALWLDAEDYFIDWSWPAEKIQRFVYAVGHPYEGAHTIWQEQVAIINDCAVMPYDLLFPIRQPGKVWSLTGDGPIVVCGSGLLRITAIHTLEGAEIRLTKLRTRFRNMTKPTAYNASSAETRPVKD